MWVLIFVVAMGPYANHPVASTTQEFTSREKCIAAASQLEHQALSKNKYVVNSVCVPK